MQFLSRRPILLCILLSLAAETVPGQMRLKVPRSDGHSTPLMLYKAANVQAGCAPLAIISHGAGASERSYSYLARAMAQLGYTTIVMGHVESEMKVLRHDIIHNGLIPGMRMLVANPTAENDRLLDLDAALDWADGQCHAPFRVLLGHSMGAETAMFEAGATNTIGIASPPAGQDRFDAYVAMSPEGPGVVFASDSWKSIQKPVLILTGTHDTSLQGGPPMRLIPWTILPGLPTHCQWEGVIDRAAHLNFDAIGLGAPRVTPLVTRTVTAFLAGVRKSSCNLPPPIPGITLKAK